MEEFHPISSLFEDEEKFHPNEIVSMSGKKKYSKTSMNDQKKFKF